MDPTDLYRLCNKAVRAQRRYINPQDTDDLVNTVWVACTEAEVEGEFLVTAICDRVCRVYRRERAKAKLRNVPLTPAMLASFAAAPEIDVELTDTEEA